MKKSRTRRFEETLAGKWKGIYVQAFLFPEPLLFQTASCSEWMWILSLLNSNYNHMPFLESWVCLNLAPVQGKFWWPVGSTPREIKRHRKINHPTKPPSNQCFHSGTKMYNVLQYAKYWGWWEYLTFQGDCDDWVATALATWQALNSC